MEIERPDPGEAEYLSWKDAEGNNDDNLALVGIQLPDERGFPQRFRLEYGKMMTEGDFPDGRRRKLLPPAAGLVGRGDHCNDLAAAAQQEFQTRDREVRGPHEHDARECASSRSYSPLLTESGMSA